MTHTGRVAVVTAARCCLYVWDIFITSFFIQIGLALPMIVYFHRASISGLTANAIIVPVLSAIVHAMLVQSASRPSTAEMVWPREDTWVVAVDYDSGRRVAAEIDQRMHPGALRRGVPCVALFRVLGLLGRTGVGVPFLLHQPTSDRRVSGYVSRSRFRGRIAPVVAQNTLAGRCAHVSDGPEVPGVIIRATTVTVARTKRRCSYAGPYDRRDSAAHRRRIHPGGGIHRRLDGRGPARRARSMR